MTNYERIYKRKPTMKYKFDSLLELNIEMEDVFQKLGNQKYPGLSLSWFGVFKMEIMETKRDWLEMADNLDDLSNFEDADSRLLKRISNLANGIRDHVQDLSR